MTTLFRRLQPAKKFRITIGAIAQLLKIPKHLIVRVECWAYILFVHRKDEGGQFISYRRLQHWLNAVAYQMQNCSNCQQLQQLWFAFEQDWKKHKKQYDEKSYPFLNQIWTKCWEKIGCVVTHPTARFPIKQQGPPSQHSLLQISVHREPDAPPLA